MPNTLSGCWRLSPDPALAAIAPSCSCNTTKIGKETRWWASLRQGCRACCGNIAPETCMSTGSLVMSLQIIPFQSTLETPDTFLLSQSSRKSLHFIHILSQRGSVKSTPSLSIRIRSDYTQQTEITFRLIGSRAARKGRNTHIEYWEHVTKS